MRFSRLISALLVSACFSSSFVKPLYAADNIAIKSFPIAQFKVGSDQADFGSFRFMGGLELTSENDLVGAMSGIRFFANRQDFIGVTDTGLWYKGQLLRDQNDSPSAVTDFQMAPIQNKNGMSSGSKWEFDAEGIALKGDKVFVSFERLARIDGFPLDGVFTSAATETVPVQIPASEFRRNGGLEALATAPIDSPLKGALLAFSESSVDRNGNLFAAITDGPMAGVFAVKRDAPFNITDADFLPNGDLLLLERRFNIATGIGMRIRKIKGADIKVGALVDGEVLLDAGSGFQIDNMEGMSVTKDEAGQVYVTLISDDNHSFLQRNLLLEFKLIE